MTGSGRGIGREHALEFARQGAKVVVNDLGAEIDGSGGSDGPAGEVVDAIRAMGGEAIANGEDVADWEGSGRLVQAAVEAFGGLDVVVNTAGILRDRMFVNATPDEWDDVMRVHLRGHFCTSRQACAYWREQKKAGNEVVARIINTSSGAGLQGSIAQAAYGAAKGGIASLTLIQAAELGRYGVTANAIAPAARTRMTEESFGDMMKKPESGFDAISSIGLTEHIGRANYESYFSFLYEKLRPEGRMLNHCITRPDGADPSHYKRSFINRYVFPDGELSSPGLIISEMNDAGFEIRHEENLREHYALTLKHWCENLERNWDACVEEAGLPTARVWRLYMAASRLGFDINTIQLHQVLGVKLGPRGRSGIPLRVSGETWELTAPE